MSCIDQVVALNIFVGQVCQVDKCHTLCVVAKKKVETGKDYLFRWFFAVQLFYAEYYILVYCSFGAFPYTGINMPEW